MVLKISEKTKRDIKLGLFGTVGAITGMLISGGISFFLVKAHEYFIQHNWINLGLLLILPIIGFFSGPNYVINLEKNFEKQMEKEFEMR